MWSVWSRRRLFSTSRSIHRREFPRSLRPFPISPWTLVARTTWSRLPFSAFPTVSSERPREYTSAVSMKLIPPSMAASTMRMHSASSVFPQSPNIMAPKQNALTWTPVRPNVRYCMRLAPFRQCVQLGRVRLEMAHQELLHHSIHSQDAQGRMRDLHVPAVWRHLRQERAEFHELRPKAVHELGSGHVAVPIDGLDPGPVGLRPPKGRLGRRARRQDLRQFLPPVAGKLRQMGPHLPPVPALPARLIRLGQAGRRRLLRQSRQPFLDGIQPVEKRQRAVVHQAVRNGSSGFPGTTVDSIRPSCSTSSATTSPGFSQGYSASPCTSESSRMHPVPHVPLPITSPGTISVPRDA